MKRLTWVLLFSLCSCVLRAETSINTESVKRMVVFIYPEKDGRPDEQPSGTGFLIIAPKLGQKVNLHESNLLEGELWLITARHIVDPAWAGCPGEEPTAIYMRVNKKKYDPTTDKSGIEYLRVPLVESGHNNYFVREDNDRVDAAIILVGGILSQGTMMNQFEAEPMPLGVFATSEEMSKYRIGDSIISAGLLPRVPGEKRNYPFFKFGSISNIPDEPLRIGCFAQPQNRLEHVWFTNINLVGGNSGSPIFYEPPEICLLKSPLIQCPRGLNRVALIGVQSSSLGDPQYGSTDIGGMTPIEDVYPIIEKHSAPGVDLTRGEMPAATSK